MKLKAIFLIMACLALFVAAGPGHAEDDTYYARCNLKIVKGSYITWVNWQATTTMIPVGTKLKVTNYGSRADLLDIETGKSYTLDIGAEGNAYLEKFVTRTFPDIWQSSEDIQRNIAGAVAKVGMTKEQVYMAMGPPAWAGENTNTMTYEAIMRQDLWTYKRKRFAKNIGVSFDPLSGVVIRTEGIWGK